MISTESIARFVDKQKRLLRAAYDEAWQRGVNSYEPDADPDQDPPTPLEIATAGLTGAALLAVLRRYRYVPPPNPDAVRRAVALAPAFTSTNRMGAELSGLSAATQPETAAAMGDMGQAMADWADANAYRLDAGAAVAWAGEQAGFAEAANQDGQFLYAWSSVGDQRVCNDCELLSSLPPMPLSDWPTSPGAGDTECSYGCRCSWDTFDMTPPDAGTPPPDLSPDQADLVDTLSERQLQALGDMMPDAAYLE